MPAGTASPRLGAIVDEGGVVFTVWAPAQHEVAVVLADEEIAMEPAGDGYFSARVGQAREGSRYWLRIAQGLRPDPASRFQPDGVSGPSAVVDPGAYRWRDRGWPGAPPAHRQVLYELHLGTFTIDGTWSAARERLPHLAALGVTTLEIMPIAEFDGDFGWGYDGVFLFAPYRHYGTPDEARAFVDAAHAAGLAVILDVVYNHLGPSGNVLPDFSASYFADRETEWGRGFNLDGEHSAFVRHFMRENVRHWLEEYHFDGLRFDATQALVDRSPTHIVHELTAHARRSVAPRSLFICAENEPQDTALIRSAGSDEGVDSLWNEDWHHAAFVALTGAREAYFTDYRGTAQEFASMARWNLLYQGQWYSWQGQPRGTDSRGLPNGAFVCFLENHDQVANTGHGRRLHQFVDAAQWRAMTTLLLLGPSVPLLFQGQEAAVPQPFVYFAGHDAPLAEIVRRGRLEFLSQFPSLAGRDARETLPDPADETVFRSCRLDWRETPDGHQALRLYTDLLALRRSEPVLSALGSADVTVEASAPTPDVVVLRYERGADAGLCLVNLGRVARLAMNDPLLAPPAGGDWEPVFCSERSDYGGRGAAAAFGAGRWRLQAHCAWFLRSIARAAATT